MQGTQIRTVGVPRGNPQQFQLLQLPEAALDCVLQQLDQRSLACTAVTCSKLRHAAPAAIRKVVVRCSTPEAFEMFDSWLEQQSSSSSLNKVTKVSIVSYVHPDYHPKGVPPHLGHLPCPQLRQLHLEGLRVQLEPSAGYPGVLQDCSGLTALTLQGCWVPDSQAAAAAVAALPELLELKLEGNCRVDYSMHCRSGWQLDPQRRVYSSCIVLPPLAGLQQLLKLRRLSLVATRGGLTTELETLTQLSALVNLEQLHVHLRHFDAVSGGVPSQLSKLTSLDIEVDGVDPLQGRLQQFSYFTALKQLSISGFSLNSGQHEGIQRILPQLTSLQAIVPDGRLGTAIARKWVPKLTALESLVWRRSVIQPEAIGSLTQLRALFVQMTSAPNFPKYQAELLSAVSNLPLLTKLDLDHYPPWPSIFFKNSRRSLQYCLPSSFEGCVSR